MKTKKVTTFYVVRDYSCTDVKTLWKVVSRPLKDAIDAEAFKQYMNKTDDKYKHFIVSSNEELK